MGGKLYDGTIIRKYGIRFDTVIAICEDLLFVIEYLSHATGDTVWNQSTPYFYRPNIKGAVKGRYEKDHIFKESELTEISALEKCEKHLIPGYIEVRNAWEMRKVKAATNTLRTMVANGVGETEERARLHKMIKGYALRSVYSNSLATSSKISILLSAISPRIELYFRARKKT